MESFEGNIVEVIGQLKAIREEQPLQSHRLSNHEDRISVIEKKLQINPNLA